MIVVEVEGGCIQWVHTNGDTDGKIVVVDYDVDGVEEEELEQSPLANPRNKQFPAKCVVYEEKPQINPDFVNYFKKIIEK